jgi:hypothetical protein
MHSCSCGWGVQPEARPNPTREFGAFVLGVAEQNREAGSVLVAAERLPQDAEAIDPWSAVILLRDDDGTDLVRS